MDVSHIPKFEFLAAKVHSPIVGSGARNTCASRLRLLGVDNLHNIGLPSLDAQAMVL